MSRLYNPESGLAAVFEAVNSEWDAATGSYRPKAPAAAAPSPVARTITTAASGHVPPAPPAPSPAPASPRAAFDASPALQREFGSFDVYEGWLKYEADQKARQATRDQRAAANLPVIITDAMRAGWRAEWERDPALRAEFLDAGVWLAYCEGTALGRLRVIGKSR